MRIFYALRVHAKRTDGPSQGSTATDLSQPPGRMALQNPLKMIRARCPVMLGAPLNDASGGPLVRAETVEGRAQFAVCAAGLSVWVTTLGN